MSELLEEFAEYEIVCDSGDGESIKVKDVKRIRIDSEILNECYVVGDNTDIDDSNMILKGDKVHSSGLYEKGTKEFEKVFEKFLIERLLK